MYRILAITLLFASPLVIQAQTPTETLSGCFADNTSGKDRKAFARWIFLAIAAHPEIKQYTSATAAQAAEDANKTLAAIFTRLITDSCAKEVKATPEEARKEAFKTLGALAIQELASNPDVAEAMGAFSKYLDKNAINGVLEAK